VSAAQIKTVLVTGGSGFIGSHVIDRLLARGVSARNLDLVASPYHAASEVETNIGSVTDAAAVAAPLAGCEAVVHLAAVADVNAVDADPTHAVAVNDGGTLGVLEACRQAGVRRVAYGSTVWAYSDCAETHVDEESVLAPPRHTYTVTKLAGEEHCALYAAEHGLEVVTLRFGIPYGPRARVAAVVPAFVERALAGQPLQVAGDGAQARQFVYVEDLAEGIVTGLLDGRPGRVYNLVGDEMTTVREVAEAVRARIPGSEVMRVPARAGDLPLKVVSSARAREELGWAAATPFAEGLDRYVRWRLASGPPAAASA
jgi:UDP-glucose 4-epimerase